MKSIEENANAEWSKEDEKMFYSISNALEGWYNYLKLSVQYNYSVCVTDTVKEAQLNWLKSLQPQPHKETYQAAKHDLAIKFINYLDENRPKGKMCLSNGECEDIDRAFEENDWAKIMRYAEKYQAQQEQKPEAKLTGRAMRGINEEVWVRLDRKSFPDLKDEPVEVEITIKKKNAEL